MVAWSLLAVRSCLVPQCRNFILKSKFNYSFTKNLYNIQTRGMKSKGGTFIISPGNFQWNYFKDLVSFYFLLGIIPAGAIILYCNIFIGPATLKEIPEGYEPKPWEYYEHPISRFIARYIVEDPQKQYEKALYVIFTNKEKQIAAEVEQQVKNEIAVHRDFQAWYYSPYMLKYIRKFGEHMGREYIKVI